MNVSEIKRLACGREAEIVAAVGGISAEALDGRQGPCPKCQGHTRFRWDRAKLYGICNQCAERPMDFLALVGWLRECEFPETLRFVSEYLGRSSCPSTGTCKMTTTKEKRAYQTRAEVVGAARQWKARSGGRLVGDWSYHDVEGLEVAAVLRFDFAATEKEEKRKEFTPISVVDGLWRMADPPGKLPLYGLPDLLSRPHEVVYHVEGEKCAESLRAIGLLATTSAHGCKGAMKTDWTPLAGRTIVSLPDNDEVGRGYVEKVAGVLRGLSPPPSHQVLALPDLEESGDVADWIDARDGAEPDDLRQALADIIATQAIESSGAVKAQTASALPPRIQQEEAAHHSRIDIRRPEGRTEASNAKRLMELCGDNLRYCAPWGKWLFHCGTHWMIDTECKVESRAKQVALRLWSEVRNAGNQATADEMKAVIAFASASNRACSIANTLTLARSEEGIPILPAALDQDPMLLNCPNGTLDLRTGELRPHRRSDLLTKLCPTRYVPNAACPTWDRIVNEVLPGAGLAGFLQRTLGYCLTGLTVEHILWIFYGEGANGKSLILNTIREVMGGDYAHQAPPDLLIVKKGSHPTERADLFGKRLVSCIEVDRDSKLAEGLVKSLTGGDPVTARRMREDFWTFNPTHKVLLAVNHLPGVDGVDHGIWRRIRQLPFTVTIPHDRQDKKLPEKLKAELEGILAWLVRGCMEWQRIGLAEPDGVKTATENYRLDSDTFGEWIADSCIVDRGFRASSADLHLSYERWSGEKITAPAFAKQMRARGYRCGRISGGPNRGRKEWLGLGLLTDE